MDNYIALVEDDGTNLYHQYNCSQFKADSFWAYNISAAKSKGFEPCPECYNK